MQINKRVADLMQVKLLENERLCDALLEKKHNSTVTGKDYEYFFNVIRSNCYRLRVALDEEANF